MTTTVMAMLPPLSPGDLTSSDVFRRRPGAAHLDAGIWLVKKLDG